MASAARTRLASPMFTFPMQAILEAIHEGVTNGVPAEKATKIVLGDFIRSALTGLARHRETFPEDRFTFRN